MLKYYTQNTKNAQNTKKIQSNIKRINYIIKDLNKPRTAQHTIEILNLYYKDLFKIRKKLNNEYIDTVLETTF